jgi:rubrerythrin
MKTAPKHNTGKSSNVEDLEKQEAQCSVCMSGHLVAWSVEPPAKCPYCNAELSSTPSDSCTSMPGFRW